VYGESAPSYSTVTRWSNEFLCGRETLEDDLRSGRPSDAVNPSVIAAVEKLIRDDRRIKVLEIARTMQISCGSVETIMHDHLKMSKVCARWVPRKLTDHDHARRVTTSQEIVDAESDPVKFVQQIVTGDEMWVHHWARKAKLSQCSGDMLHPLHQGSSELYPLLGNSWRLFLWDNKGLLLIDYLPPSTTMHGQYYASLLLMLCDAINEKRRGMRKQGVWLLHDNAPIHKSMIAQEAVRDCVFVQLDHPAYSPDQAPSDYYLFRNLKSHLRDVHYPDDEVLQEAVREWLEGQT